MLLSKLAYTCLDYSLLIFFLDPIKTAIVFLKRQIVNIIGICNFELLDVFSEVLEYVTEVCREHAEFKPCAFCICNNRHHLLPVFGFL